MLYMLSTVFCVMSMWSTGDPLVRGSEPLMRGSGACGAKESDYSSVEDATIHLMRQCCQNHPHNQALLASTLCHLIQRQNVPPPGNISFSYLPLFFKQSIFMRMLDVKGITLESKPLLGVFCFGILVMTLLLSFWFVCLYVCAAGIAHQYAHLLCSSLGKIASISVWLWMCSHWGKMDVKVHSQLFQEVWVISTPCLDLPDVWFCNYYWKQNV